MRIACVVLAAGLGKRFGGPKSLAESTPGVRFLDAVIASADAAGFDPVVAVVGGNVMVPNTAFAIVNPSGEGEQIESARLGLTSITLDVSGALLWPVDHPFVDATTLRALRDAIANSDPDAAVPVHEGRRGHPVYFAKRRWAALHEIQKEGARAVLRTIGEGVLEVPVGDPGVLADVDTPEALASWRAAHPSD